MNWDTTFEQNLKWTAPSKSQFHQRFTRTFFVQNFGTKKFQIQNTAL